MNKDMPSIRKILQFLVFSVTLGLQSILSQDQALDLKQEINKMISSGDHTFRLMKSKVVDQSSEKVIVIDEKGKIVYPSIDFDELKDGPKVVLKPLGTIKLYIKFEGSKLFMLPIEDSFCPKIVIDFESAEVFINDHQLTTVKSVHIQNDHNGFNSAWQGYRWQTNETENNGVQNQRFTIGKLKEGGKIYLEIIWLEAGTKYHYRLLS